MACIGELPTEFWGPHPRFGLREEIQLFPVFTFFKQRRKRTFNLVFVRVVRKEKRAARAKLKNLLFFIYLLGLFRLTFSLPSPSPSPSSLLPGFIDVRKRLGIRTCFW